MNTMNTRTHLKHTLAVLGLLAVLAAGMTANAAKAPPAAPVNINTATMEQLTAIPGIGAAKARAIINYRAENKFTSKEGLLAVKGIGEKLLSRISPYITVGQDVQKQLSAKSGK